MSRMARYPHLYEANARVLLNRLSVRYNRPLTLATIPEKEWQRLASLGFDLVWLMGVWQRSPAARGEALRDAGLRQAYNESLPGWTEQDVAGSPYAVYRYSLDPHLGKEGELRELKERLNHLGLGLILDFVPNHLACDHPWVRSHPGRFVRADETRVREHPDWFFSPDGKTYFAHGRDPYFPPWRDTVQVNFFSADMREAMARELARIMEACDGVRCDMAMLAFSGVFEKIWGSYVENKRPAAEFWQELLAFAKVRRPDFLFLAEAYWDMEWELQEIGFDFTYDKVFYDRLRDAGAGEVRGHLTAAMDYQRRSARFIENHDELRAAAVFGKEKSLAAAVILATVPGLRLFHDGQLEGRKIRLPIQLIRETEEPADPEIAAFYEKLLAVSKAEIFREGAWQFLETKPAPDKNSGHENILGWSWTLGRKAKVIVVNLSSAPAEGRLLVPRFREGQSSDEVSLRDDWTGELYLRRTAELCRDGLYFVLAPWEFHVLDILL